MVHRSSAPPSGELRSGTLPAEGAGRFTFVNGSRRRRRPGRTALVAGVAAALAVAALPLVPLAVSERSNTANAADLGAIRYHYTVPSTIDATGATDVTRPLQKFLDAASHHSEVDFPAGARYRIEGTLVVDKRNDFVVNGNGATFFATTTGSSRTRSQWSFDDDSNLEVSHLVIRGAEPHGGQSDGAYVAALEAQHGINVSGGERIDIHDNDIADTYGDFIYVSRSPGPVFGHPTDVHIHDNVMARNGRMGITVADGTGVLIDHNDISDTRRATIDLEPYSASLVVRDVTITDNHIGPGRLYCVAGLGAGDVSDITVTDNVLEGHSMAMDLEAPGTQTRYGVVVTGNVSDTLFADPHGTVIRLVNYVGAFVRNNVQPTPTNRRIGMVQTISSCEVIADTNDISPGGTGQLQEIRPRSSCPSLTGLAAQPASAPAFFDGQRLDIDVGNTTDPARYCYDVAHCSGYLTSVGDGTHAVTAPLVNPPLSTADRTMLVGTLDFAIPIRNGTYRVTMGFVEPTFHRVSQRIVHVDAERQRLLNALDPYRIANGMDLMKHRAFDVTVGDGTLNIEIGAGSVGAILSTMSIVRE
jgi:Right handed beta helix region/Malectin domain